MSADAELVLIPCLTVSSCVLESTESEEVRGILSVLWGPRWEWVGHLSVWILHSFLQSDAKLLNRMHLGKQSLWGLHILQIPFSLQKKKEWKRGSPHEFEKWKAWWNSSLLAAAQADSSVCRSNRWPWSWVARKLVIKYFNSDWFGNLRFIKSRVKSFVIPMARCLISPPYFAW